MVELFNAETDLYEWECWRREVEPGIEVEIWSPWVIVGLRREAIELINSTRP